MNTWFNSVDIYCERLDASFWAEPINAITNLSFIVAGLFIWRLRTPRSNLMAILMILIGLGSFSFHTFANRLTGLFDVLAIALYLVVFAFLIPKQWSKNSILIQLGSIILLIVSIVLAQLLISPLKSALPWLPARHVPWGLVGAAWLCFDNSIFKHASSAIFMVGGHCFSNLPAESST
jgi:hypothetical protein